MRANVGSPSKPLSRDVAVYRCQFCCADSPAKEWKRDSCPKCGRAYDAMLAQEGDDG